MIWIDEDIEIKAKTPGVSLAVGAAIGRWEWSEMSADDLDAESKSLRAVDRDPNE